MTGRPNPPASPPAFPCPPGSLLPGRHAHGGGEVRVAAPSCAGSPSRSTKCSWKRGSIAVSIFSMRSHDAPRSRRAPCVRAARCARRCRPRCRPRRPCRGRSPGSCRAPWRSSTSMWLPKAPASVIRSTGVDAVAVHQQPDAGVERGLGELDGAHVVLRDARVSARPRAAGSRRCGPSASTRGVRAAMAPSTTPSWVMMPARYISAITSMMPEPQMPVTPVCASPRRSPARRTTGRSR